MKEKNFKMIRGNVYEKVPKRRHELIGEFGYAAGFMLFMATPILYSIYTEEGTSVTAFLSLFLVIHWFLYIVAMKYCHQIIGYEWIERDGEYKFNLNTPNPQNQINDNSTKNKIDKKR